MAEDARLDCLPIVFGDRSAYNRFVAPLAGHDHDHAHAPSALYLSFRCLASGMAARLLI
jgi:hypothetical protein